MFSFQTRSDNFFLEKKRVLAGLTKTEWEIASLSSMIFSFEDVAKMLVWSKSNLRKVQIAL